MASEILNLTAEIIISPHSEKRRKLAVKKGSGAKKGGRKAAKSA